MEDSVFYSGPSFNVVSDNVGLVTRKENYAKQVLSISSLVSYWRLGDYAQAQNYSQMIIADRPTAYWRLNDTGTTATDRIRGFNGTLAGGITTGVAGAIADGDTSMTFNGSTGAITISPIPLSNSGNQIFSIEGWAKVTSSQAFDQPIVATDVWWMKAVGLGTGGYIQFQGGDIAQMPNNTISVGNWFHWVAVQGAPIQGNAGRQITLYINGVQVVTSTHNATAYSLVTSMMIGHAPSQPGDWFTGGIDEIALYDYVLTPAQIMKHYATGIGKYAMTVLGDTPLSYYRLDDIGTSVQDYVSGFNGAFVGGVTKGVAGATSETDTAMTFDGATGYLTVTQQLPRLLNASSIECWVNHNNVAWSAGFEIGFHWGGSGYIGVTNGQFIIKAEVGGAQQGPGGTALSISGWHHLVGTYDGKTINAYLDGVLVTTQTGLSGTIRVEPAYIGNLPTNLFNGSIDECAVYGYTLSAQQVAQHYAAGKNQYVDSKAVSHLDNFSAPKPSKGALPSDGNSSALFDGIANRIRNISIPAALQIMGPVTIEAWVKPTSETMHWQFSWYDGVFKGLNSTVLLKPGNWYHIVATRDAGNAIVMYTNGKFDVSGAGTAPTVVPPDIGIGANPNAGGTETILRAGSGANQAYSFMTDIGSTFFNGSIQDVAIYNTALSPQQILANYEVGTNFPSRLIDIYGA